MSHMSRSSSTPTSTPPGIETPGAPEPAASPECIGELFPDPPEELALLSPPLRGTTAGRSTVQFSDTVSELETLGSGSMSRSCEMSAVELTHSFPVDHGTAASLIIDAMLTRRWRAAARARYLRS